jgi:hypothetical protein
VVGSGRKGKGEYCTVIVVGSGETDKECGRADKWDNRIMKTIDGGGGEEDKESNYVGKWKRRTRKAIIEGRKRGHITYRGKKEKRIRRTF